MVKEWKEIHKGFDKSWGEHLKEQWKNNDFDYNQVNAWINVVGLEPREYNFAWWLANQQSKTLEQSRDCLDELRANYNKLEQEWKNIHQNFLSDQIIGWIKKGFVIEEVEKWTKIGCLNPEESSFADYLKKSGYDPLTVNITELRREYYNAQKWLDETYLLGKRSSIKKLSVGGKKLEGNLKLEGFSNLEELYCHDNQLTGLDCSNCPQLKIVRCQKNNLIDLNLTNCSNITELYCNRNQLTNLDFLNGLIDEKLETLLIANNDFSKSNLKPFSRFVNLKKLGLGNWFKESNNHFIGSLKPLETLTNLKELDIAGTDIDSGLENLFADIQIFYCSAKGRPNNKAEAIAEELREYSEPNKDDDGDENFASSLRIWKEFHNSLAQKWLNENYTEAERAEITYLDISKKNLVGALKLEGFTNLLKLDCSKNQLTNLNLSDCQSLVMLDCSENKLHDLYFLSPLNRLEHLIMYNNQELSPQKSLKFLTSLLNLKELNANDCPWEGNLKSLENLSKLEVLKISNTNIEEGLEYLSTNCKKLYCNSSYKYKSVKIIKELEKSKCSNEKHGVKYYNLDKWREGRSSNIVASVVPLERLFVIRSNIKKFVDKWGKETEDGWHKVWKNQVKITELSKLRHPNEFSKQWWLITGVQWANRATSVVGGSLLLVGTGQANDQYTEAGGVIAIVAPFVETITSYLNEKVYDAKQKKWDEFINDAENLLDNYHELLGILEKIKKNELGIINQALNSLRTKTRAFLEKYDSDDNGTIDISELVERRTELETDLSKENAEEGGGKLGSIVQAIKDLEKEVINYRQGVAQKETEEINQQLESQATSEEQSVGQLEETADETESLVVQIKISANK